MKVYWGNASDNRSKEVMREHNFGIMYSGNWNLNNAKEFYFSIDNGAFSTWINNREYDGKQFLLLLTRCLYHHIVPDFAVCPDKVGEGTKSLRFSLEWLKRLPRGFNYYLAVQNGITAHDIKPYLDLFKGLFVGGTLEWKYKTSERWVKFAHDNGLKCHIGRIGTLQKVLWAIRINADSIDSTSWPRNKSWEKHLLPAFKQKRLDV